MYLCLVFVMLSNLFLRPPAGKGLISWLLFVMFIVFLSLSHVVFWVGCGTGLYKFLIFAVFLTLIDILQNNTYIWWVFLFGVVDGINKYRKRSDSDIKFRIPLVSIIQKALNVHTFCCW